VALIFVLGLRRTILEATLLGLVLLISSALLRTLRFRENESSAVRGQHFRSVSCPSRFLTIASSKVLPSWGSFSLQLC
jgi:hypothetical protein